MTGQPDQKLLRLAVVVGGIFTFLWALGLFDFWSVMVLSGYGLAVSVRYLRIRAWEGGLTKAELTKVLVPAYKELKGEPRGKNTSDLLLEEQPAHTAGIAAAAGFAVVVLVCAMFTPPIPLGIIHVILQTYFAGLVINFWGAARPREGFDGEKAKAVFAWPRRILS